MENYSKNIASDVENFLREEGLHFEFNDHTGVFRFGVALKRNISRMNMVVDVREHDYLAFGFLPICGDAKDREMMMRLSEFINLVNYDLVIGNFEMDFADGEIRYKSFVDCKGLDFVSNAVVKNSICIPMSMVDRFGKGLMQVICGGNAKDAYESCADYNSVNLPVMEEDEPDGDVSELIRSLMDSQNQDDEPDVNAAHRREVIEGLVFDDDEFE